MSAGAIGGTSGAATTPTGGGFAAITSDQFIKIMVSELTKQDPLNPQDTSKLLEQLSSIRNIESQVNLQDQLESLVMQNQVASAGNLIGKVVTGLNDSNYQVSGLVTSVRVQDGNAILELDSGNSLSMDRVTLISGQPTG
ncbi:MAG: hypothetical protein GC164_05435 [Phycisphaera sp.]|nr:hypothetical protein [Phycisphaera sp.]